MVTALSRQRVTLPRPLMIVVKADQQVNIHAIRGESVKKKIVKFTIRYDDGLT
jgi:hypothetical protein